MRFYITKLSCCSPTSISLSFIHIKLSTLKVFSGAASSKEDVFSKIHFREFKFPCTYQSKSLPLLNPESTLEIVQTLQDVFRTRLHATSRGLPRRKLCTSVMQRERRDGKMLLSHKRPNKDPSNQGAWWVTCTFPSSDDLLFEKVWCI